jgi:low affinity Fe/Cu permease
VSDDYDGFDQNGRGLFEWTWQLAWFVGLCVVVHVVLLLRMNQRRDSIRMTDFQIDMLMRRFAGGMTDGL